MHLYSVRTSLDEVPAESSLAVFSFLIKDLFHELTESLSLLYTGHITQHSWEGQMRMF